MRRWLVAVCCLVMSGCSVYMAANQPEQKNISVVAQGIPRSAVIAELGAPLHSEQSPDSRTDIFKFHEGSSMGAKVGRAVFHTVADVFTIGLWEVVGTPTEALIKGDQVIVTVTYDANDLVVSSNVTEETVETSSDDEVDEY